jgi:hypothetical protein
MKKLADRLSLLRLDLAHWMVRTAFLVIELAGEVYADAPLIAYRSVARAVQAKIELRSTKSKRLPVVLHLSGNCELRRMANARWN